MSRPPTRRKVLLIGWDAADWEHINPLLEEGLLPTLESFINRGVMGNLATLQPILSPMLWNSIATGKYADKHGIHGFIEPDPINGGARPYSSTSRKVKALWNILSQSGLRSNVIGWWASHPAEPIQGNIVTNAFGGTRMDPKTGWQIPPGTVHPPEKAKALARFKVFPSELTHEHILPFIPLAAKIDQKNDERAQTFAKILSDAASIHAVATALMESEPWDFTAVYYDAIDHFCHAFMPYHPPKMAQVKDEDFEIYKDVVRSAYRFHDMMLERLLHLAGPETTVILCSDHGFESGSQRPEGIPREPAGPAIWHRQYGVFVAAGPDIRRDERIYGASLIDITPTILTLFGLPVGEDMDGRALLEIFEHAPKVEEVPNWEDIPGDSGVHSGSESMDRDQADELMQQFAALGYIEDPGADREKQAESAKIEADYNLARQFLWRNRPEQALPLLQEILNLRPWEDRFIIQLASAFLQGGFLRQAEKLLTAAYDLKGPVSSSVLLLWGKIQLQLGNHDLGLDTLMAVEKMSPRNPQIHTHIGDVYLQRGRLAEAKSAYDKAIEIDADSAFAWQGLSSVFRRLGQNEETAETALRAVSLLHRLPLTHFNLGVALARSGNEERAKLAFETALHFKPNMVNAHRFLAFLHKSDEDRAKFRFHRAEISRIRKKYQESAKTVDFSRRDQSFAIPSLLSLAERHAMLLQERPNPKSRAETSEKSGKSFVLVSGLPRSGTSLMMQLLEAGGMTILTDGERAADIDNPRGYYEWEAIKEIGRRPELLDDDALDGRVIKCISMLLRKMPPKHNYKVVFMTRPLEEVVSSQSKMVSRLGTKGAELNEKQLEHGLRSHRDEILTWLKKADHMDVLEIDYTDLIHEPTEPLAKLAEFLGADRLPHAERMSLVIDPSLYRRRRG